MGKMVCDEKGISQANCQRQVAPRTTNWRVLKAKLIYDFLKKLTIHAEPLLPERKMKRSIPATSPAR